MTQINGLKGFVLSIPSDTQVVVDIDSSFSTLSFLLLTLPLLQMLHKLANASLLLTTTSKQETLGTLVK